MKYLKYFEKETIKHSNSLALNNPLRDFSRKLEDIINEIKEINNSKRILVRRYFFDDNTISIKYTYTNSKIMEISLKPVEENVSMSIYLLFNSYHWLKNIIEEDYINCGNFVKFVKRNLEKYIVKDDYNYSDSKIHLSFPLEEKDKVLKLIEEYRIFIDTNKYNL